MKVLIFGGAGFVGRHYTEHFLSKKYYVEIVDNIAPLSGGLVKRWKLFNPLNLKKFKFINQIRLFKKLNKKFDLVINLAAIVGGKN